MKCENREEKISLYIDRQLEWKEEKEFLKHIKECPECKQALQQAQQLRQMLLDLPMEEVPQGLHESIMQAIHKEMDTKISPPKRKKNIAWQKYSAIAASVLILVGATKMYFGREMNTTNTEDMPEVASMQLEEGMAVEEQILQISPTITQTKSVKAPETAKALPATPYLASIGGTGNKAEGEEEAERAKIEGMKETAQEAEAMQDNEENGETQQEILTQPIAEGETTKKDAEDTGSVEEAIAPQSDEEEKENAVTNTIRRSVPTNMKSKSLQISMKTKNVEKVAEKIEKRTKSLKGEIETPYEESSMTIKVPVSEYNDVVNWLGQQCEVVNKNEIVEDLGKQYKEIQQQLDEAKQIEKQATQKEQPRKAQEARKTQKECEKALEELQKTANFATIHITFVE